MFGRFASRGAALDFLVAKYGTAQVPATYLVQQRSDGWACVFRYRSKASDKSVTEEQVTTVGATLEEAITAVFARLDEPLDAAKEEA